MYVHKCSLSKPLNEWTEEVADCLVMRLVQLVWHRREGKMRDSTAMEVAHAAKQKVALMTKMNVNVHQGPEKQGNHDVENLSQILHACWLISCFLSASKVFPLR